MRSIECPDDLLWNNSKKKCFFASPFSWGELLARQPKWITDLISHVEQNDIAEILEYHYKEKGLIAVSDGSEKTEIIGFGWRLCSRSGKRLGYATGPGFGRSNSLRAEGTGMLSIALFLGLVTTFFGHESLRVPFLSDNLGLINRSRDHLTYTISYVNTTVFSCGSLVDQSFSVPQYGRSRSSGQ